MAVDATLETQVLEWISADPDPATRAEATSLLSLADQGDPLAEVQLRDAFSGRLSFGTAGLRAELGAGPARMNRVVVSQTSAGFASFLLERAAQGETSNPPTVVIGYDGRINSDVFARDTAEIMAGAGLSVTLLPKPLPTPVTAFAVRHLNVSAGVMVTASHNPPRDNGYKVYLGDADAGSQIIPPIDGEIATLIDQSAALPFASLARSTDYTVAGDEVQQAYVEHVATAVRAGLPRDSAGTVRGTARDTVHGAAPDANQSTAGTDQSTAHGAIAGTASGAALAQDVPLRIAYTAMHGVGTETAKLVFRALALPEVTAVPEQEMPDGLFPTVAFPNPEEPGALDLAFRTAREIGAELIVAHDPDADRLAIALPNAEVAEGYRRLTGNELGLLLGWRAAERARVQAEQQGGTAIGTLACTNVSSPALRAVARDYGLNYAETLSGFKWVSRVPQLVFGFEEAIGYLTHPEVVRDKDGILASADAIAMAREAKLAGKTLWDLLDDASMRFGHFASTQIVVRLSGMAEASQLAEKLRTQPLTELGGVTVTNLQDLLTPGAAAVPANVLCYWLADGSRVMIRPSGTEPKLKVYIDTFAGDGTLAERQASAVGALATVEASLREYLDQEAG